MVQEQQAHGVALREPEESKTWGPRSKRRSASSVSFSKTSTTRDILGWYLDDKTSEIHRGVTFIYSLRKKTAETLPMGQVGDHFNDQRQVVGFKEEDAASFFYDGQAATSSDGGGASYVGGINNAGLIVGRLNSQYGPGVVWRKDGQVEDVNDSGAARLARDHHGHLGHQRCRGSRRRLQAIVRGP